MITSHLVHLKLHVAQGDVVPDVHSHVPNHDVWVLQDFESILGIAVSGKGRAKPELDHHAKGRLAAVPISLASTHSAHLGGGEPSCLDNGIAAALPKATKWSDMLVSPIL